MANPVKAFPGTVCAGTVCDGCGEKFEKDDDLYFNDGERLCEICAEQADIICECGQAKKPEYDTCYSCLEFEKEND